MTPGTVVLVHSPLDRAAAWGGVPETLRSYGLDVVAPDVPSVQGAGFIARAALIIAATAPRPPLVLVGHGEAGPLLPLIGAAQRAAHRLVGGYVFVDARLPSAGGGRPVASADSGQGHLHDHEHRNGHAHAHGHAHGHAAGTVPGMGSGPGAGPREPAPPPDWPDAPCGYLSTKSAYDQQARLAQLRGWPTATSDRSGGLARA